MNDDKIMQAVIDHMQDDHGRVLEEARQQGLAAFIDALTGVATCMAQATATLLMYEHTDRRAAPGLRTDDVLAGVDELLHQKEAHDGK